MTPLPRSRWLVCVLLLLATTLNYLDRMTLNQLINKIRIELNLNDADYAALESNFALAFGLGTLFFGWLADRVSVRWLYPAVVFLWSLAGFFTGFANSFMFLMICRVCLGFTEAGNWPCGIRTTRTVLPPEERSFGNALFQSGTAIGAIITPLIVLACYEYYGESTPGLWVVPFRVIGLIGFLWVFLWFLAVPSALFVKNEEEKKHQPFHLIFKDRRFWILIFVILGANSAWHTIRVWLPRMLNETWSYGDKSLQYISSGYYLSADIGSWTVGLATLWFARAGVDLARIRVKAFAVCTIILVISVMLMTEAQSRQTFLIALMIAGFAALGLFPTYFALSQDLSAKHQGKVTGLLGCINAVLLAGMFRLQGPFANKTADYDVLIMLSTIPPMIASILLILFWKSGK